MHWWTFDEIENVSMIDTAKIGQRSNNSTLRTDPCHVFFADIAPTAVAIAVLALHEHMLG